MNEKIKVVKLPNCNVPFKVKNISAKRMNSILKKNTLFGVPINAIAASEEICFACVVFPDFETKEDITSNLTSGQFSALVDAVMKINDYPVGGDKK